MLGIVIGVGAVVTMNAIGNGARERVTQQIRSLGANLISIYPGSALMASVRLETQNSSQAQVRLQHQIYNLRDSTKTMRKRSR